LAAKRYVQPPILEFVIIIYLLYHLFINALLSGGARLGPPEAACTFFVDFTTVNPSIPLFCCVSCSFRPMVFLGFPRISILQNPVLEPFCNSPSLLLLLIPPFVRLSCFHPRSPDRRSFEKRTVPVSFLFFWRLIFGILLSSSCFATLPL